MNMLRVATLAAAVITGVSSAPAQSLADHAPAAAAAVAAVRSQHGGDDVLLVFDQDEALARAVS